MPRLKSLPGAVLAALTAVVLAACGGGGSSSSGTTTTTQSPTQAMQQITTNWTAFFNGANADNNSKRALLQNSQKYAAPFNKNFNNPAAATTLGKVDSVSLQTPSQCQQAALPSPCAKVTYDLVSRQTGAPLLANQTGYAVYQNGQWLISGNTFCALIMLTGDTCPA